MYTRFYTDRSTPELITIGEAALVNPLAMRFAHANGGAIMTSGEIYILKAQLPFTVNKVIVLDETIAKGIERNTKEKCESENDFYELLGEILNSDKIKTVVNSLLFINRKAEAEKNAVITEVSENNDNNSDDSE